MAKITVPAFLFLTKKLVIVDNVLLVLKRLGITDHTLAHDFVS